MNTKIKNPHDRFFKEFFGRKAILRSLYTEYLIHLISYRIDINTIELFQNDSVNEQFEERLSDLVLIARLEDSEYHVLILLEHKSTRDPDVGKKLDDYMYILRQRYAKMHPEHKKEIRVITVVVYHGLDEREIPQNTASIYDPIDNDYRYVQTFQFEVFNISTIADDQIKGIALLRIGLYVLKYIQREELLTKIDNILEIFKELPGDQIEVNLDIVGRYIENAAISQIRHQVVSKIINWFNLGERKVSRILEILQRQGFEKGMEKGIEKGKIIGEETGEKKGFEKGRLDIAQRMIIRGINTKLIQEITSLPIERLTQIREKIDLARKQLQQDIKIREIQKTTDLSMDILENLKRLNNE